MVRHLTRSLVLLVFTVLLLLLSPWTRCAPAAEGAVPPSDTNGRAPAGQVITNSIDMKLVPVPAGEFKMGSAETPEALFEWAKQTVPSFDWKFEWLEAETPQHRVHITKPFSLGRFEVTRGQFRQFVEATGYQTGAEQNRSGAWGWTGNKFDFRPEFAWSNTGFDQTDDHPVVNVTWNDAVAFCEWLSRKETKKYRLPTEAEWEYACRAGTTTRYYNGDNPEGLTRAANVADSVAKQKFSWWKPTDAVASADGFAFTAPVGKFQPNAFGLYDMHGNVDEWCADLYEKDYYGHSPAKDPQGPDSGSSRVMRGGGWLFLPILCRSAYRGGAAPSFRGDFLGFRVVAEHE